MFRWHVGCVFYGTVQFLNEDGSKSREFEEGRPSVVYREWGGGDRKMQHASSLDTTGRFAYIFHFFTFSDILSLFLILPILMCCCHWYLVWILIENKNQNCYSKYSQNRFNHPNGDYRNADLNTTINNWSCRQVCLTTDSIQADRKSRREPSGRHSKLGTNFILSLFVLT